MDQKKNNIKQGPKETKKEVRPVEKETEEKKKMGTGAKIAIGCGVLLLLGLIALGALALAGVSFFSKVTDEFEGIDEVQEYIYEEEESDTTEDSQDYSEDEDEDDSFLKKSTEQGLDEELESSDMLTEKFPEDIPLSGGKITSSSYTDSRIIAELDVDATVKETKEWYVDALRDGGWEITKQSESEPTEGWTTIDISFESTDGERRGDIKIELNPYTPIPHVRIRELLY